MRNIAFINCIDFSDYGFRILKDGRSALDMVLDYVSDIESVSETVLLTGESEADKFEGYSKKVTVKAADFNDTKDLFELLTELSEGFEHIFYMYGDCPFLDIKATQRIYASHLEYFAQYSFADGNPYGIMPEIISAEIISALKVLAEKKPEKIERDSVFRTIQKDINSFDIETDISEKDLRLLRINLTADSKRNFELLKRFTERNGTGEKEIYRVIDEDEEILRTLPSYFQIQISERCLQKCSYCPYPVINPDLMKSGKYMDADKYMEIIENIYAFSEDAVISLSLWGEASLHPEIEKIVDMTMGKESLSLLIETSGLGWKKAFLEKLSQKYRDRITWIISLDTDNIDLYRKVRGEGYEEAAETALFLLEKFPETCFVQAVRMNETEEFMEEFFKTWKKRTENVIVQKYDSFSGFLEERKVTDISPLKRFPCWHLKRDFCILVNGDVPLCREDIKSDSLLGNVFREKMDTIWERGKVKYLEHINEKYSGICGKCDEYYTYNF